MTLAQKVAEAIKDCRDQLDRIPSVTAYDDTVEVWVNGWASATAATEATKAAIEAAGLVVAKVYYQDLGDEDCIKMCGFITVRETLPARYGEN